LGYQIRVGTVAARSEDCQLPARRRAVQVTYEAVRVVALTNVDEDAFKALVEHTRTGGFASWDSAVAAVWLHGSADVVVAATQLDEAVGQLFYAAVERTIRTPLDWNQARTPARQAFERFVENARKELDLPRVPVRIFADPPPVRGAGPNSPQQ
jgi:hypothetical protein